MSEFAYHGPLGPESTLFRGRTTELERLARMCQGEIGAYAILFGGRQMGKTSLLLRLPRYLPTVRTCRVDMQFIPGATSSQVYTYLAQRVATCLPQPTAVAFSYDAPGLITYLCDAISQPGMGCLTLLLEELGALPADSRHDLANVLRAIFVNRYEATCRPLSRMMVVLAGGIELYDLAATEVSPLRNICEEIHLPPLAEAEAVGLVADGLQRLGTPVPGGRELGEKVYDHVGGHPYLTQRLGAMLEEGALAGNTPSVVQLDAALDSLLVDNQLVYHLHKAVREHDLLPACGDLIHEHVRFGRMNEAMARLELLGLAGNIAGYWRPANPLLARAMREWLDQREVRPTRQVGSAPRVFLSSTWEDLQPERQEVHEALDRMRDATFVGMEYFGSRPETPREISLTEVERSTIYVGILAHRYGSGITEAEYRRARELGLPCFIYIKRDDVPVKPAYVERDPERTARLEAFRKDIKTHHTISTFESPDDLAGQIVADLHRHLTQGK